MTSLKSKILETRTQADLNAIYQNDDYTIILDKIKQLSSRGKEDLITQLNIIVLYDAKYGNNGVVEQKDTPKMGVVIPIDFLQKKNVVNGGISND